jgi:Tol biopolymer transport system component
MGLRIGTQLGPYEILSAIGAGGMGEVYRARDSRLNRDVALKVLPEIFAADPDRMARFEREARVLGALNHPNIAAIYGLEEFGSGRALVMELVEGETLADRIAKGPIPLDEALPVAKQMAEALEYAHDRGVVHRDLKPANIKVTPDGTVKVLDFGLAKALMDEPVAADPRDSPTLSMAPTMAGAILGTAAYMSPEQAKGKPVDRRADIWAFGVVLFEMLTGKPLYSGETAAETLASVMKEEPAPEALPKNTPPAIQNLLRRCLEKNLRQRLQHIGEARILIETVLSGTGPAADPGIGIRKSRERLAWAVAAIAIVIAALSLGAFLFFRGAPQDAQTIRFFVYPPDTWRLAGTEIPGVPLAVSPDGRRLAFVATNATGKSLLWVRLLDALTAQALTGTDGASSPFWSPDSRFIGFFAAGKLKKIEASGGSPITLCDAADSFGGAWSRDGVIVFAQYHGFARYQPALQKVSASGGAPTAATVLAEGETTQLLPFFLPDGRHFLYRSNNVTTGIRPIYLASLDSAERKLLLNGDSPNVLYTEGYLLFLRDMMLMAQPFDARRLVLTGDAFPIAEQIQSQGGISSGVFSASDNGVLAYQTGLGATGSQLTWFDRTGKQVGMLGDAAAYSDLEFSPDWKRASISIPEAGKGRDIWLYEITRGLRTRFTFDSADDLESIWSPDGSQIVFNSRRKGHLDLYQKASSGAGTEEVLVEDNLDKYPLSWSPDGRFILYVSSGTNNSLFALPLSGDRKPFPFLKTQFNGVFAQFSPDGRWVAYQSNVSGRAEVYVAPFPGPGGQWQISTAGGSLPRWRRDGVEIFYLDPDNNLMAVAVNGKGGSFDVGAVKLLFGTHAAQGGRYRYGVSADGQRFLINTVLQQSTSAPITVVLNWTAGLKK